MELKLFFLGVAVILIVCVFAFFIKIADSARKKKIKEKELKEFDLMLSIAPFEEYLEVAGRTSVLNGPIRSKGDCYDFILNPEIVERIDYRENNLAFIECGEVANG